MEGIYSPAIAEAVSGFLNEEHMIFSFDEKEGIYDFDMDGPEIIQRLHFKIVIGKVGCLVYAVAPLKVNQDNKAMLQALVKFFIGIQSFHQYGQFELDRDDHICCKSWIGFCRQEPSTAVIRGGISYVQNMFHRYALAIADVSSDAAGSAEQESSEIKTLFEMEAMPDLKSAGTEMEERNEKQKNQETVKIHLFNFEAGEE